jgi:hypothetical protein
VQSAFLLSLSVPAEVYKMLAKITEMAENERFTSLPSTIGQKLVEFLRSMWAWKTKKLTNGHIAIIKT